MTDNDYGLGGPPIWDCPSCGYEHDGPMWGPYGLCRDCYDDNMPSPYCKHGTYIGGSSGADYLCGRCEMGDD